MSGEAGWPASQVPMLPREALSLEQALTAYTLGSAYVNGTDEETGSISVGKAADLVVLDRDPFEPGTALYETTAALVFIDGQVVHES